MNKLFYSVALSVASIFAAPAIHAQLLQTDWEEPAYEYGDNPRSPWSVYYGGTPASTLLVTDAQSSPFQAGSQSLHITQGFGTPSLTGTFSEATTSPLSIAFDFYLPTGGNSHNWTVYLRDGTTNLINLNLRAGGWMTNQLTGAGGGDQITPIDYDTWYHVAIETTAASGGKYDITVTPAGGSSITASDLSFRNAGTKFTDLQIIASSGSGSSNFYLDNVSVNVIPEPGAAHLVLLAGAAAAVGFGMRKARQSNLSAKDV